MYDDIKGQVRSHFQDLQGRIGEVQEQGCLTLRLKRGPFIIDVRRGHFLYDQIIFTRNEIEYWKYASERDSREPDQ